MKKTLIQFFIILILCNTAFAETYYFKECKLSEKYLTNYSIDFDEDIINIIQAINWWDWPIDKIIRTSDIFHLTGSDLRNKLKLKKFDT